MFLLLLESRRVRNRGQFLGSLDSLPGPSVWPLVFLSLKGSREKLQRVCCILPGNVNLLSQQSSSLRGCRIPRSCIFEAAASVELQKSSNSGRRRRLVIRSHLVRLFPILTMLENSFIAEGWIAVDCFVFFQLQLNIFNIKGV